MGANQLKADEIKEVFAHIEAMLETLKYGSITLVVQDGKIVQIDKNEKVRLQSNKQR
ncbi:YezD family protein [Anaerobacillus sp. CMMVII]|uniref:YezD family protein n=1 Tax=Anaerobacillus sp. CMMVII TaxID=2755588 RepID=UPI0021B81492|nr:YezD family protein [Anaerobacillus sp. CMMVII]MCT8137628.1 YezD family protein [Anaerobacillus sp. CMMVII]